MDETERRMVKYEFNEEERREIANVLARSVMEVEELRGRLKSIQTQIKAEIVELEGRIFSHSEKIRSGYEMREMDCIVSRNYETGIKYVFRPDTYDTVSERKMTQDELQMNLPLVDEDGGGEQVASKLQPSEGGNENGGDEETERGDQRPEPGRDDFHEGGESPRQGIDS